MQHLNFELTLEFIKDILSKMSEQLGQETIKAVKHYLDHDGFEMAFEGLFLDIMKLKTKPLLDYPKSKEFALFLNLDKESVFEPEFWTKFTSYIDKQN